MKRGMMNVINPWAPNFPARARSAPAPFAILATLAISFAVPCFAQHTFPSAEEAAQSLVRAVQANNVQSIDNILGGHHQLASSGDELQDKLDRQLFVQKYQQMHRLAPEGDGSVTLYIGAENWPFPIPLVKKNGVWHFDSDAGAKEVLFRRIGENELTAIEICHEFVAAEKQPPSQSADADPVTSFAAGLAATAAGHSTPASPALFGGYYFRVLPGPTLIAYPAAYRSSGVMTFVATDSGAVYQKDLGSKTAAAAIGMATFHADASWQKTDQ